MKISEKFHSWKIKSKRKEAKKNKKMLNKKMLNHTIVYPGHYCADKNVLN